jgi:hypothetical protein
MRACMGWVVDGLGVDVIKDTSSKLPHMFPSPEKFAMEVCVCVCVHFGVIVFVCVLCV